MSSKAQGLSLNTIIIAAIVLIVLLVLVGLLTGFFGNKFGPDFRRLSDTSCNGEQVEQSQACPAGTTENYAKEVQAGKKCCELPACPGTCVKDQQECNDKKGSIVYNDRYCKVPTPTCCK